MNDEIMANQLRDWASLLGNGRRPDVVAGVIAGMEQIAKDLDPKVRIRERIVLERRWYEDREYVESRKAGNPIEGWMRQIREEFDEAASSSGVFAYQGEGASVIAHLSEHVTVSCCTGGDMKASFSRVLYFLYQPNEFIPGVAHSDPTDVIDHLFFTVGDVAGNFHVSGLYKGE